MAKKVEKKVKLVLPAGKATPAPPVGPIIGGAGINIGEFVKKFNDGTADRLGELVPVEISVYGDRSFSLVFKTPPASSLLLKAAGAEKGSGKNVATKVGKVTLAQVREIAEKKLVDLNTTSLEQAMETIKGTARSMGIEVKG
jgi:large subunit ribosomal protein L11